MPTWILPLSRFLVKVFDRIGKRIDERKKKAKLAKKLREMSKIIKEEKSLEKSIEEKKALKQLNALKRETTQLKIDSLLAEIEEKPF